MKQKKAYVSPEIRSEAINVGVFGKYGGVPACPHVNSNTHIPPGCNKP